MAYVLTPAVSRWAHASQRGGIKGAQIIDNILAQDAEMRAMSATASHDQDPCAILFDMHAAFPSVDHH